MCAFSALQGVQQAAAGSWGRPDRGQRRLRSPHSHEFLLHDPLIDSEALHNLREAAARCETPRRASECCGRPPPSAARLRDQIAMPLIQRHAVKAAAGRCQLLAAQERPLPMSWRQGTAAIDQRGWQPNQCAESTKSMTDRHVRSPARRGSSPAGAAAGQPAGAANIQTERGALALQLPPAGHQQGRWR